ncbi:hypothetical protein DH2020_005793 [Rehmannia glutinosa]|uniref:F-box domain-containing protein n=1 Tax=Rehmannia glutinosa TaxID=99300 RepID=A0ABR0XH20_REHGL
MELPNDLFTEVLVRLPLKDIFISRCVCRAWNTLITTPYFTSYYANNSPFTSIILTQDNCNRTSFFLLEFGKNGDFIQTPIKPKLPEIAETDSRVSIIGSCDGSIFLLHRRGSRDGSIDNMYLCNPLFERCVKIAEDRLVNSPCGVFEYKVCYIPSTNSYKLLKFRYHGGSLKEAKIFTVGVDKDWRNLEDPFTFLEYWSEGVCFNGAYHWVADNENLDNICTFDLLEEKCSGIPKPPGLLPFLSETVSLTILNDRLSVVDYSDCSQMNIWTMDKYGVAESWFRNIILLKHHPRNSDLERFLPIAILPNGNIIFYEMYSLRIYFFSLEEKKCSRIKLRGVDNQEPITMANAFKPRFS